MLVPQGGALPIFPKHFAKPRTPKLFSKNPGAGVPGEGGLGITGVASFEEALWQSRKLYVGWQAVCDVLVLVLLLLVLLLVLVFYGNKKLVYGYHNVVVSPLEKVPR